MALNGTLQDLGTVELLQLPHSGRKTGELIVVTMDEQARFYYERGALVHAVCNEAQGMDVLVEAVGWKEGEFELRLGVEPPARTIEMDLHRAMMNALKIRDEREKKRREHATDSRCEAPMDAQTNQKLAAFVAEHDFAPYAAVLSERGKVAAQSGRRPENLDTLTTALGDLLEAYPRAGLKRVFLDDEEGTVVLEKLPSTQLLMVLATPAARMGAVTLGVSKLAALLG